jgi:hypothetical protein
MNELGLYRRGLPGMYALILSPNVYIPLDYYLTCGGWYLYIPSNRKLVSVLT